MEKFKEVSNDIRLPRGNISLEKELLIGHSTFISSRKILALTQTLLGLLQFLLQVVTSALCSD